MQSGTAAPVPLIAGINADELTSLIDGELGLRPWSPTN